MQPTRRSGRGGSRRRRGEYACRPHLCGSRRLTEFTVEGEGHPDCESLVAVIGAPITLDPALPPHPDRDTLRPEAVTAPNLTMGVRSESVPEQFPMLTIGHSTLEPEVFAGLLTVHAVTRVVDVRTVPRSRHNPGYNRETLPDFLRAFGIAYEHMPGLGGLRHPRANSSNTAWRNASFRGFADYMQTDDFERSLEVLTVRAAEERIALMCAEAVPWRCHRSLIADALTVRGIEVQHIMSNGQLRPHTLTPSARRDGTRITYPSEDVTAAGS
jgi:hypothetical protein